MFKTNLSEPYGITTVKITNNPAGTADISCNHCSTITLCNPQKGLPCIKLPSSNLGITQSSRQNTQHRRHGKRYKSLKGPGQLFRWLCVNFVSDNKPRLLLCLIKCKIENTLNIQVWPYIYIIIELLLFIILVMTGVVFPLSWWKWRMGLQSIF